MEIRLVWILDHRFGQKNRFNSRNRRNERQKERMIENRDLILLRKISSSNRSGQVNFAKAGSDERQGKTTPFPEPVNCVIPKRRRFD